MLPPVNMRRMFQIFFVLVACLPALAAFSQDDRDVEVGPFFAHFPLTLQSGYRTEAAGPLFYDEESESQWQWALPPLFCYTRTADVDWSEADFLYPVFTYRHFGGEYRAQILQLWSFAGGQSELDNRVKRLTLFPIYFQQRSPDRTNLDLNYTAVVPLYGRLEHRLFRDEIKFVLFPVYSQTRKRDVVTDNFLYPFFDVRHGIALKGWQFWPLAGVEHKDPNVITNNLGELETVGGHDNFFALWPFYFKTSDGVGTTNESKSLTFLPFYSRTRSPARDQTSYGWPLGYNIINDREKHIIEHDVIWPLIVKARGTKYTTRVFPFYSQAHNASQESDFYMWPVYKFNRLEVGPLVRTRTRILFFLYSDTTERNRQTGEVRHRKDFWPFYTYRRRMDGRESLQVLAITEPFFPENPGMEREYSQIWSFWRQEKNPHTGATSQSLLWNLYRRSTTPQSKNCSLLFGLFQYQSGSDGRRWRVFHLTVAKSRARPVAPQS
jgi:hypothetical protein